MFYFFAELVSRENLTGFLLRPTRLGKTDALRLVRMIYMIYMIRVFYYDIMVKQ